MSVYNGFGTRQQESEYNKTLYKSAFLLQLKITKDLKGEKFDDHAFMKHFCKLYHKLFLMEQYKYLPPKFSYALKQLAEYYGVFAKIDKNSLSSNSSHLSFHSQKNLGKTAKMHPEDAIFEKEEPIDQEYLQIPDQPYQSPFRSKPRHQSRYPEQTPPQQYHYTATQKKRSKGSRVQTRRLTNTRGSGGPGQSSQNIVSMPGKPVPPLFMPPINGKEHGHEKDERMIESPRSTKHPSIPNTTAKFARKDPSPNTTINNNNIIININKSYNVKSEENQEEPKQAKDDSPPQKDKTSETFGKEDELNEKRMKEAMLEELEDSEKMKTEKNELSTSDFANPSKVRAGNIFSKRSLSPKNSRTISPLEKQPLKNKFAGTSPISRPQLSSLPDSYSGYRMTPAGRGTQLEPIQRNANYQQQVQMQLRKQSRTGGSHYNQRNYSNHPDYAYQQPTFYQDVRSESPGVKRLSDYGNATQTLGARIKRKQAHYVPAAVSFDGIRNDFEKNFSKMRIKKYGNTEDEQRDSQEHSSLDPHSYPPTRPPHALPTTSEGEQHAPDDTNIESVLEGGKTPISSQLLKKDSKPSEKALSERQISDSQIITPKLNQSSSSNLSLFRVTAPYALRHAQCKLSLIEAEVEEQTLNDVLAMSASYNQKFQNRQTYLNANRRVNVSIREEDSSRYSSGSKKRKQSVKNLNQGRAKNKGTFFAHRGVKTRRGTETYNNNKVKKIVLPRRGSQQDTEQSRVAWASPKSFVAPGIESRRGSDGRVVIELPENETQHSPEVAAVPLNSFQRRLQYHQMLKERQFKGSGDSPKKRNFGQIKDNELHVSNTIEEPVLSKEMRAEIQNLKEVRKTRLQRSVDKEVEKMRMFLNEK